MIPDEKVQFYNPRKDGYTMKAVQKTRLDDRDRAIREYEVVRQRILEKPIMTGQRHSETIITGEEYFYGRDCFFAQHPRISAVMIVNGKLVLETENLESFDEKSIAQAEEEHEGLAVIIGRIEENRR